MTNLQSKSYTRRHTHRVYDGKCKRILKISTILNFLSSSFNLRLLRLQIPPHWVSLMAHLPLSGDTAQSMRLTVTLLQAPHHPAALNITFSELTSEICSSASKTLNQVSYVYIFLPSSSPLVFLDMKTSSESVNPPHSQDCQTAIGQALCSPKPGVHEELLKIFFHKLSSFPLSFESPWPDDPSPSQILASLPLIMRASYGGWWDCSLSSSVCRVPSASQRSLPPLVLIDFPKPSQCALNLLSSLSSITTTRTESLAIGSLAVLRVGWVNWLRGGFHLKEDKVERRKGGKYKHERLDLESWRLNCIFQR